MAADELVQQLSQTVVTTLLVGLLIAALKSRRRLSTQLMFEELPQKVGL